MISQVIYTSSGYMEDKNGQLSKYPIKVSDMGFIGTNPIAHLLVCIRRDSLNLLYDKNFENGKDFDLWKRFFVKGFLKKKVLKNRLLNKP